ncbi:MAG: hypothetical protein WBV37_01985 [Nocardioidaceae bacterium]
MSITSSSRPDATFLYEIRLQGQLDPRWSTRFDGMTLTTRDGFTVLTGAVVDQAALHGLLNQLRDVGLALVSVTRVGADDATRPPRHPDTRNPGA